MYCNSGRNKSPPLADTPIEPARTRESPVKCQLEKIDSLVCDALATAVREGDSSIVQLLLDDYNADPNFKSQGQPVAAWASQLGHVAIFELLLRAGAIVDSIDHRSKDVTSFDKQKGAVASSFFAELDKEITKGEVSEFFAPTGGVKLVWSSQLVTTAGRTECKREVSVSTGAEVRYRCSIKLGTNIIDDIFKLYNVLAHEFCHVVAFMKSGFRCSPHGKTFKFWGGIVSETFKSRKVIVTTTHNYPTAYKYVWKCIKCGNETKRWKKTIDINRHACPKCYGRLAQTK